MRDQLKIISKPSPNFDPRPTNIKPKIIVIHYTAMLDTIDALDRLCDPESKVSSHYLIDKKGQIFSLVGDENRAWHAGIGVWRGCTDVNSSSIGIELSNSGDEPYSFHLMESLVELVQNIMKKWDINPNNVIGHSDLAPDRKKDPGRYFDWAWLEYLGLTSTYLVSNSKKDFWECLRIIGYKTPVTDKHKDDLLEAFRTRYCINNLGSLDNRDILIANGILKSLKK